MRLPPHTYTLSYCSFFRMATCTNENTVLRGSSNQSLPHLPGILPKLCVALLIPLGRVVDSSVDPMSVPLATLAILTKRLA